ncbi:serine protease grass-like [Calliphora vicina]|uniref:serine protease grass-like n=1 Tax=Calliphora vicina TaxID=7373 RepID=UPI00325B78D8
MFYIFIIILPLTWTITQGQYGANCKLPNQQNGLCVPVKSCKTTYELFNNILHKGGSITISERKQLLGLQCGNMRNNTLVCCEESEIQLNPVGLDLLKSHTCGIYSINRLAHGSDAVLFGFPWMALLKFDDPEMPFKCGGSLISDQYVLTAAHCINETSKPLIAVRLGEHRISTDQDCMNLGRKTVCAPAVEDVGIEEIIKHNDYKNNLYHDIALLRLNRKVQIQQHIKTICLPIYNDLRTKEYPEYVISGWGATENGSSSDVLQVAVIPKVVRAECQTQLRVYHFRQEITIGRICAGGANYIDTCKGDSGGPMGYKDFYNGKPCFIQYGIVSAGMRYCGRVNAPAMYTNVSHYIQWITDQMY